MALAYYPLSQERKMDPLLFVKRVKEENSHVYVVKLLKQRLKRKKHER